MPELLILEILAGIFLLLPDLRLPVKNWQALDGLYCLPPVALLIVLGIFPAYGFRPECVPLLICALSRNIAGAPALFALLTRLRVPQPGGRLRVRDWLSLGFLAAALGLALVFVPVADTALSGGVESHSLEAENGSLNFRVYRPEAERDKKTAILVAPPVFGGVQAVDLFCQALRGEGFTAITWSRADFDFPSVDGEGKKRYPPAGHFFRMARAAFAGRTFAGANALGREFEAVRRADTEFLLDFFAAGNAGMDGITALYATGFGEGGGALLHIASERAVSDRLPALRGIIAIESLPFWMLRPEAPPELPAEPENAGEESWFSAVWRGISGWAASRRPRQITGLENTGGANIPFCLILSGRARSPRRQDGQYAAPLRYFYASAAPAALVSVSGAGKFDFADWTVKYPLVAFPLRGNEAPLWPAHLRLANTAALIARFVRAGSGELAAGDEPAAPDGPFSGIWTRGIAVEYNRVWNDWGFQDMLAP